MGHARCRGRSKGTEQERQEGKIKALYHTGWAGHCKDLYFDFDRDRAGVGGGGMSWGEQGGGHCSHPGERHCWLGSSGWQAQKYWTVAISEGITTGFAVDATETEDTR